MKDQNKIQTEWELQKNVVGICADCSEQMRKDWQKKNKNLKINIGDFVKVKVTDKNGTENLWFGVTKILPYDKKQFIGTCDNTPVIVECIKYGELRRFHLKDISNYIKK